MWNLIFEALVLFLCVVCSYRVAKCYGSKFKEALSNLDRMRQDDYGFAGNMFKAKVYLVALSLFEIGTCLFLYLFSKNISAIFN